MYYSGFIYNENIHRITTEYTKKPKLVEQMYGHISNWDVSNVSDFSNLFSNLNKNYDISDWNITNATNFSGMFSNNKGSIENLNKFTDTFIVLPESVNFSNMFSKVYGIENIFEKVFNTGKNFTNIFSGVELSLSMLRILYSQYNSNSDLLFILHGGIETWHTTVNDLLEAGFQVSDLHSFELQNVLELKNLLDVPLSKLKEHFSLKELSFYFSVSQLKEVGFTIVQLYLTNRFSVSDLFDGGFQSIYDYSNGIRFYAQDLINVGFSTYDLFLIDFSKRDIKQLIIFTEPECTLEFESETIYRKGQTIKFTATFNELVENVEIKLEGSNTLIQPMKKNTELNYEYEHVVEDGNGLCVIDVNYSDLKGNTFSKKVFFIISDTIQLQHILVDSDYTVHFYDPNENTKRIQIFHENEEITHLFEISESYLKFLDKSHVYNYSKLVIQVSDEFNSVSTNIDLFENDNSKANFTLKNTSNENTLNVNDKLIISNVFLNDSETIDISGNIVDLSGTIIDENKFLIDTEGIFRLQCKWYKKQK